MKTNINKKINKQIGYASVSLIVFVVVGITITTAAVATIIINMLAATKMQEGIVSYHLAESGLENGILRLIRDPVNYSGEIITTPEGSDKIEVALDKKSITSTATVGNYQRTLRAQIDYTTGNLVINSWKEIY